MVYPGAESSIRFEKLREGIVDFEKIRILKAKAGKASSKNIQQLLQELDQLLAVMLKENQFHTEELRKQIDEGKKILDTLSDQFSQ